MTARATVADFLALGLPAAALSSVPSVLGPVVHTGTGAGLVAPSGTVNAPALALGTLAVVVTIIASGAPGTATYQYSTDGGTTFSATATTPGANVPTGVFLTTGASPTPGLPSGLLAAFSGAFVAGDTYAWPATSNIQRALNRASDTLNAYLDERYVLPLAAPYPDDLLGAECDLAAWFVLKVRGFDPKDPADIAIANGATQAIEWAKAVRARDISPGVEVTSDPPPYVEVSFNDRGLWCER